MFAGAKIVMSHPDGYATITGSGGQFVGWIPNGIQGSVYLLTSDQKHALVNFEGKLLTTVPVEHLRLEEGARVAPAA